MTESWVTQEIADTVAAHMNGDHADDNVVICRVAGGRPDAVAARMTGMDEEGIDFLVEAADGSQAQVRVPFGRRLAERAEVRTEVARLFHESEAALEQG